MSNFFTGKVLLITGAGGSFGSSGVDYFLALGCDVIAWDINLSSMQANLSKHVESPHLLIQAVNVTDEAAVKEAIAASVVRFSKIDLLWNNAGYQGKKRDSVKEEMLVSSEGTREIKA